jgi:hypothetical protein
MNGWLMMMMVPIEFVFLVELELEGRHLSIGGS